MRTEAITWEGGEHEFALPVSLLLALEERTGDGIGMIQQRLAMGQHTLRDVMDTVSLSLEGGGMPKREAVKMVRSVIEDHGLNVLIPVAHTMISVAHNGWPDDADEQSGEAEGANP